MAEVTKAKWALITGGSRGIGRAIALELARKHGLNIVLNYASHKAAAPALALGVEPADHGVMEQPPRDPKSRVLTGPMWVDIAFVGVVMAIGKSGGEVGSSDQ